MLFLCVCVFLQGWVLFGFVVVLEALKGVMGLLGGAGLMCLFAVLFYSFTK